MGRRIRQARLAKGVTQQQVADHFGISRAAVAQWEGDSTNPGTAKLQRLAEVLEIRIEWLTTGQGPTHPDQAPSVRFVPLIDLETAATWPKSKAKLDPGAPQVPTDIDCGPDAFMIRVTDQAMVPDFKPGDRVIADPAIRPRPGDHVVARVSGFSNALLRRYREVGHELETELVASNSDWETIPLRSKDGDKIVATVTEHRRYRSP